MKILVTGGGSGGHIAPVLAVAHELKKSKDNEVVYVGQSGDAWVSRVEQDSAVDRVATVSAGKLRRYSGEGWRQLLDIQTQVLNLRDVFRTLLGVRQSYHLLGVEKPDVVFTRGGFVSVPVALAARLRRVPYITHDADSVPSLANRIIARWAARHAVALPASTYPYNKEKVVVTGIPVAREFAPVSPEKQLAYKRELHFEDYDHVVLITGGGNGARALNLIAVANAKYLLSNYPDLLIVHFTGGALKEETAKAYERLDLGGAASRVRLYDFATDFYRYIGAADVAVGRGGMSSLAEFALQKKACVLVPSPQLAWNVKNSHMLAEQGAVQELTEDQAEQPDRLGHVIGSLISNPKKRAHLGDKLSGFARPTAARDIARLIEEVGRD